MNALTELEIKMINDINKSYDEVSIGNTEFFNMYPYWVMDENGKHIRAEYDGMSAEEYHKIMRGVFASLKKKKIVMHTNDPECFNPIYPTQKLIDVCKEYNLHISNKAIEWVNRYIK